MKKKLIVLLLCISTMMLIAGCSITKVLDKDMDMLVSSDEPETSSKDVYKIPKKEPDLRPVSEPSNMDPIPLVFGHDKKVTYVFPDGTLEGTYDIPAYSTLIGFDGFTVYYYAYDIYYDGDEKEVLYSYDVKTKTDKEICRIRSGSFMSYYKGKICFLSYGEDASYKEYYADVNTGEIVENTEISDILGKYSARHDYDYRFCSERFFDEAGYILLYDADRTYMYDKEAVVALSLPKDAYETVYWDDTSVYVNTMSDYEGTCTLYRYDIKDSTVATVSDKYQGTLAINDNRLYWYESENESNGETKYHVYYIDLDTFKTGEAVTMRRTPGISEYYTAISSFTPCETGYFYAECGFGEIKWCYSYVSASGNVVSNNAIAEPIRECKWKEIGSVQAVSNESYCAKCGKKTEKYYEEFFVLDSDLSPFAKDINDTLYGICQSNLAGYGATDPYIPADDSECEYHGTYMGMASYEHTLSDAKIIKDHYLTVDMNGYMYMGGAHGMPFTGHYLFNLNTGKEVLMSDLFNGTEEQFKELIATKVKEDLLSYEGPEYAPYYTTDPDELYESAYESATLDLLPVGFNEDGLYIDYQPYAMGPYAAGFIVIYISYDDIDLKWD